MKALFLVRYGDAHQAFSLRESLDLTPKSGEVRIAVEASGLNFADIMARMGLYPEAPKNPAVLGYEVVGRIDQLGPEVDPKWLGKRVLALTRFGGYATQACARVEAVVEIPKDWNAGETTALGTQGLTAVFASHHAVHLIPGDRVLVHAAAGGVGLLLTQIAKSKGCFVIGTARGKQKQEFMLRNGVDLAIDTAEERFEHRMAREPKVDVIFDSIGGRTFRMGLKMLAPGGRMVSFGAADMAGKTRNPLRALRTLLQFGIYHPLRFLTRSQTLAGINILQIADHRPHVIAALFPEVIRLREAGVLKPHLGRTFPAEKVADAHVLLGGRGSVGKVALLW
jgi:NADPH2:quinone reductase